MLVPPWVVRVSGSRAMRPTRITRLVMGFLLIEHSGSIPAANPSSSAPRRSAPKGNSELGRVVRAAGHSPATRPDLIRVARLDGGDSGTGLYRSEEQTSALQSLMTNSYAVYCWNTTI